MKYALEKNLVLAASAGTGKTHALVGVVIHLLVHDRLDPARVVATTFSRKAAAEIRARVTTELEKLAAAPDTSAYLASLREGPRALDDAALRARARSALARLPHARFGTLHSFATSIVRGYAVELGLGPGFDLATEADARARAEEAIAGALERRFATNPDPVRALADAAGGIDRLVTQLRRLLVQLEEDGRSPRELAVASGDDGALNATMRGLVDHARALFDAPRFEDAARELVSAFSAKDDARIEAAATALCAVRIAGKKTPEVEAFAAFRARLFGTTNEERGRRLVRTYRARGRFATHAAFVRDVLAEASQEIEDRGRARAELGFGEILRAARELLRDRPDVAAEVAAGIDALLVDEFQDTSRVQRDLLQLLWARPGTREAGRIPPLAAVRDRGLLVVGDRKQSIYGFRGADVGVFAELAVGLAGAPAREALGIPAGVTWEPKIPLADFHALRHNRRSVSSILAFANAFSARRFRPGEPPPSLFEIDYVPETEDLLVPPERASEAEAGATTADPKTTWLRVKPKGSSSTRLEEALVVAERVSVLVERGREHRDIAVLATTNGMLDAVAFALAQADIPYVVAGRSFFRTREVRDLAAFLAFVLDPGDRIAMLEVLRGPWGAVHDETLLALTSPGQGLAPVSRWNEPPNPSLVHDEDRPALTAIAALVVALSRAAGRLGPGAILREGVRARSLEAVLRAMPRGDQRVANVKKLLAIADRHSDVRAFHRWLVDAMEQETSESEAATFSEEDDAVRLLTIHASKGLDFPIVIIPEIAAPAARSEKGAARIVLGAGDDPNVLAVRVADVDGIVLEPPSFNAAWTDARRRERAERQRLAYVAVTRAAEEMLFVGGRTSETVLDEGASTLAVLESLAGRHPHLLVEDVDVPAPRIRRADALATSATAASDASAASVSAVRPARPVWRSLPIAPTALSDFAHCARRFELVHLLGLPEHVRPSSPRSERNSAARDAAGPTLDSRLQGTIAHAVLERLPPTVIGTSEDPTAAVSRVLVTEGVPADHPQHLAIVARVTRFVRSAYARKLAAEGAQLRREVDFVLGVDDDAARTVTLRGSMDLVAVWPDGAVDVIDYKSARSGDVETYAFQLDVYALAARASFPDAPRLRAGLVFLGGGSGEPIWRSLPSERDVRARLAALGDRLVDARWTESFPRVVIERCESIHCGFIGRCHAGHGSSSENEPEPATEVGEMGTDAKPSRATTT